ncbi:MAG TPA: lytic transglycosylase domain-containing protein, partial [Stellaceae bacterium]|nr:lytic transglycosylase domain-containing protein [Stellaceae bacterium]
MLRSEIGLSRVGMGGAYLVCALVVGVLAYGKMGRTIPRLSAAPLKAAAVTRAPLLVTGGAVALLAPGPAPAGDLDRIAAAVDGAESGYGTNPGMWRADLQGPQGPMQVSAAAAADVGGGNRFDAGENLALGRAYLARMYRRYGSWADAVAAYNWGPARMDAWISGGRRADRLPATVERYTGRVMLASSAPGVPLPVPNLKALNSAPRRLGIVHAQP